jgi:hypothetical protein
MDGAYLRHALATALRVARFDKDAVAAFDHSFEGFFRSFYVILLGVPFYAFIIYAERRLAVAARAEMPSMAMARLPPPTISFYALEMLSYVASWLILPIVMIGIVRLLGTTSRYVPFVVAYNWTGFVILIASASAYFLYLTGIVPLSIFVSGIFPTLWLFGMIYRWRVARDALQTSNLNALGVAVLDFVIALLVVNAIAELRESLEPGP